MSLHKLSVKRNHRACAILHTQSTLSKYSDQEAATSLERELKKLLTMQVKVNSNEKWLRRNESGK